MLPVKLQSETTQLEVDPKYTAPPCPLAVLFMKLQLSIVTWPSEVIDPPFPLALALINVIPVIVIALPLAMLNTLAWFLASIVTFP